MNNIYKLTLEDIGNFLTKLSESSDSVYWLSTPNFKKIQYISAAYEKIWGRPRQILYDNPELWISYLYPGDAKAFNYHPIHRMAERLSQLGPAARYEENYRIVRPDGEIRWIIDRGFPIYGTDGTCYGVTGVAIDVSNEKQVEETLRKAKEDSELARRAKEEFIINMSHDLRTPLAGIIGLSHIQAKFGKNKREREYGQMIEGAGNQLLDLLNQVLKVASVEHETDENLTFSQVNLQELVRELQVLMLPAIKDRGLELYLLIDNALPTVIETDRIKLKRILLNLLANAIKFTVKGSISLEINLLSIQKQSVQLEIHIRDTGIGIALEKQNKILDRFYRVTSCDNETYKGFGIGLYLVKKFVDLLEGEIRISSKEREGSCFTLHFNFPIIENFSTEKIAISQSQSAIVSSKLSKSDRSILIVEDNTLVLYALKAFLENLNYQVTTATTAKIAINFLQTQTFTLMLIDLGLPDMSGIELTKYHRSWEQETKKKPLPIFSLTAYITEQIKQACHQVGMDGVLEKPFAEQHMQLIENFIQQQ